MSRTNHPNGFSLIELILIVLLVGIFAVMMIPFFGSGVGGSASMLNRQQNFYELNSDMAKIAANYEANYASDLAGFKSWLQGSPADLESGVFCQDQDVLEDGSNAGLLVTLSSAEGDGELVCLFTEKE